MPDWKPEIARQLEGLRLAPAREAEIVEELAQHLEDQYAGLISGGAEPAEARRVVVAELRASGLLRHLLEPVERPARVETVVPGGGSGRVSMLADLRQDLFYGLRMLRKSPRFTLVAVATLALGIGANTAIFSVINGVLLKPLAFKDSERLVILWTRSPGNGVPEDWLSVAQYGDIKAQADAFDEVAITLGGSANMTGTERPMRVEVVRASSSLFPLLSVKPALGRTLSTEEDKPGPPLAAVLSDGMWRREFGADPGVIGRSVTINGTARTVVGVLPPGFALNKEVMPVVGGIEKADMILSLPLSDEQLRNRSSENYNVLARMKPGVTAAQARAQLETISARLTKDYPDNYPAASGFRIDAVPLLEQAVGESRRSLWVLYGAVGFVLLIACANVANLLLSRTASRQKEIAVRTALGASRLRLVRQLLSESVLLSVIGGALGLLLAAWSLSALRGLDPGNVPRLAEIGIDYRVLAFTFGLSLATGVLFGLAPAWKASRVELNEALKDGGRAGSGGPAKRRMLGALVVAEVALSLVLLAGAGLLVRSFVELQRIDPGFDPQGVLSLRVSLSGQKYSAEGAGADFFGQLFERVRALPGVESAGGVSTLPLSPGVGWGGVWAEGSAVPTAGNETTPTDIRVATTDYFRAMRIPLLRGRAFGPEDTKDGQKVAVVDEAFAARHWPGGDAVGRRVRFGATDNDWMTVVGVVGRVKQYALDAEPPRAAIYTAQAQQSATSLYAVVRTTADPGSLAAPLREVVASLDRDLPVYNVATMEERFATSLARRRFSTLLLGAYAGLALLLAAVGIYGVMAYSVEQRTHEIGIRLALGSDRARILRLFVREGMALTLVGLAVGLVAGLALVRVMSGLLYGVEARDPVTFAAVGLVLASVALLACLVPARRATKVDPMIALRHE